MIGTFDDNASLADVRATLNKVIVGQSINDFVAEPSGDPDAATQLAYGVTPIAGSLDDSFLNLPPALADTRVELVAVYSGSFQVGGLAAPTLVFASGDDALNGAGSGTSPPVAWTTAPLALDGDDDVYAAPALVFECVVDGQWITNGILFDG